MEEQSNFKAPPPGIEFTLPSPRYASVWIIDIQFHYGHNNLMLHSWLNSTKGIKLDSQNVISTRPEFRVPSNGELFLSLQAAPSANL
jgi:hypothetical protein